MKILIHVTLGIFGAFTLIVLTGCGSTPLALPTPVGKYETLVDIKSKAKILVKASTAECDAIRSTAKFETLPKKGSALPMKASCEGKQFLATSGFLNPGIYTLRLSLRRHSLKELSPTVTLELANPDYHSGPDQYAEGAVAIEAGKGFEGKVSYLDGDSTDWLRVAGEKKKTFLTFVPADGAKMTAAVYRAAMGGSPKKIQNLTAGRPISAYLGKDDLLVKVVSSNDDGEAAYTLLRRDEDAKKAVSLQVVDAYPVSSSASLVLLRPNAQVKADDELRISAKNESGQWKELGACRVTGVSNDGIQCELNGAWNERFVEYRATGTAPVSG